MKLIKFEVGDQVRVKRSLIINQSYGVDKANSIILLDSMKHRKVINVVDIAQNGNIYTDTNFYYHPSMLTKVKS